MRNRPSADKAADHSEILNLSLPKEQASGYTLLIDSPHSGRNYPKDFNFACDFAQLRRLEDAHVDELIENLGEQGAITMSAKIPRSYIDLSRARNCINPADVPGGLSELDYDTGGNNTNALKAGTGLIFYGSKINQFNIYASPDHHPNEATIKTRLQIWDAYHSKLSELFTQAGNSGESLYHLNLHSCWREGAKDAHGVRKRRPDIIVHDKFGNSCTPEFTQAVMNSLQKHGLDVRLNHAPFKGGYIVTKYGRANYNEPEDDINSIQIEFVRDLYMDEKTLELHSGIERLQRVMSDLTNDIHEFAEERRAKTISSEIFVPAAKIITPDHSLIVPNQELIVTTQEGAALSGPAPLA